MGKDARARFDEWSVTYEESLYWRLYFVPLHDMLESKIGQAQGSSVLDVGCGTGDMLRRMERLGAARLVGIDESEGMLRVARELSREQPGISYLSASAGAIPGEDERFDIVISCVAFHHFPDPRASLREIARVMKPGGRFFLCDLTSKGAMGRLCLTFGRMTRADERYFDAESLARMSEEAGLAVLETGMVRHLPPTVLLVASKRA